MGGFEEKLSRFVISLILLAILGSLFPMLWQFVSINAIIGYALGVIYVRDRYDRYHHVIDGRYISREEACCLEMIAVVFGIGVPAAITIWGLSFYALHELLTATFGAEIIAAFGGFGLFE